LARLSSNRTADDADPEAGRRRRATRRIVVALVALSLVGKAGDALAPTLAVDAPLLLVALKSKGRYILLASRTVPVIPLVAVAVIRELATAPVVYRLGQLHGTSMLGWFDRRMPRMGRMMRAIERLFGRRRHLAVFLMPGGLTAMLAGSVGMSQAVLYPLAIAGQTLRVVLLLGLGELISAPLDALLGAMARYQWQFTAATLGLTVVHLLRSRRRMRQSGPPLGDGPEGEEPAGGPLDRDGAPEVVLPDGEEIVDLDTAEEPPTAWPAPMATRRDGATHD
jgi:membrane protein DedA with SNARE-associated domain